MSSSGFSKYASSKGGSKNPGDKTTSKEEVDNGEFLEAYSVKECEILGYEIYQNRGLSKLNENAIPNMLGHSAVNCNVFLSLMAPFLKEDPLGSIVISKGKSKNTFASHVVPKGQIASQRSQARRAEYEERQKKLLERAKKTLKSRRHEEEEDVDSSSEEEEKPKRSSKKTEKKSSSKIKTKPTITKKGVHIPSEMAYLAGLISDEDE